MKHFFKIQKGIIPLFVLFLLINTTTFGQGVIVDVDKYNSLPKVSFNDGKGGKGAEIKHTNYMSMRKKVPNVIDQRKMSCVPAAFCYNAMTIEYANKLDLNSDQLNGIAFSYMFVYNQVERVRGNCGGTYPDDVCEFVKNHGDCLMSEYDTDVCGADPSYSLKQEAQKHRIKGFSKLFDSDETDKLKKLVPVQSALLSGHPVPIVINDFAGFNKPSRDEFFTYQGPSENRMGHAMVVIGYDNYKEAFEIVNTHGKDWGDNGFSYIKYDEFVKHCTFAYQLHVDIRSTDTNISNPKKTISYEGRFELQYMTRFTREKTIPVHKVNNYSYELEKKDWKAGDLFQLKINDAKEGQVIYVFSIDGKGANIHWPRSLAASDKDLNNFNSGTGFVGAGEVPFVPFENFELVIPGNGNVMFRQAKEDHIIVLFAHKPIDNFVERVIKVNKAIGSIQQRFEVGFKDLVIPQQEINYKSDQMSFSAQTDNEEGIIPMIVSMEGQ